MFVFLSPAVTSTPPACFNIFPFFIPLKPLLSTLDFILLVIETNPFSILDPVNALVSIKGIPINKRYEINSIILEVNLICLGINLIK